MKKDNPIRTSQLIRPFGAGSLYVTKDGVGLIACGLDHWYKSFNGATRLQNELAEFLIYEWGLQKQLNVSHFRTPPEFREKEGKWFNYLKGETTTLNNLDGLEFSVQGIGNPSAVAHSGNDDGSGGSYKLYINDSSSGTDGTGWDDGETYT